MKSEVLPAVESLVMLIYILASLGSFFYFSYLLLVDLSAAMAFAQEASLGP